MKHPFGFWKILRRKGRIILGLYVFSCVVHDHWWIDVLNWRLSIVFNRMVGLKIRLTQPSPYSNVTDLLIRRRLLQEVA